MRDVEELCDMAKETGAEPVIYRWPGAPCPAAETILVQTLEAIQHA